MNSVFPPGSNWLLHPQLEKDTALVGDLPLSRVLVMKDANYPWLVLVPRRVGLSEVIDLGDSELAQLLSEIAHTSRVLKAMTSCDKLNIASLGNVVSQLHVHVIARRYGDAAWPKPVWGAAPPSAYASDALVQFVGALRRQIQAV
jgi:diadenosine tetraphosphate (Ap4A) HIT family hydrolase